MSFKLLNKSSIFIIALVMMTIPVYAQSKSARTKAKKPAPQTAKKEAPAVAKSKELIEATEKLKADLEKEIVLREASIKKINDELAKKRELFEAGIISKKELEDKQSEVAAAQAELNARKQKMNQDMVQVDSLLAEVKAIEQMAKLPNLRVGGYATTAAMIRYNGPSAWVLTDIAKVDSFFTSQFRRSLPVSAFGQTEVHNRLGFDHRNSVDVALHPDSAEGQALINYLRSAGIPFIAFRQAVPGSATGAHVHIGYPSHRFTR
ncbi:MAG: hypothetical protein AB1757_02030 [Acidobacteriota bacterium]